MEAQDITRDWIRSIPFDLRSGGELVIDAETPP